MWYVYWLSADGQSSIPMGEHDTADAAHGAVDDAREELLSVCGEESDRAKILAGSWRVVEES